MPIGPVTEDSINKGKDGTAMSYFRALVDGLNHAEFLLPDYKPTYNDLNIRSLHFYHNMVKIKSMRSQAHCRATEPEAGFCSPTKTKGFKWNEAG